MISKWKNIGGIVLLILAISAFWQKYSSAILNANKLVINEYLLAGPPDISTDSLRYRFATGDQQKILDSTKAYRDYRSQVAEYNGKTLAYFGYSLEGYSGNDSLNSHWFSKIYHGEELITSNIAWMRPISVNSSKTNFIGFVDLFDGFTYTFTNDGFEKRSWPPGQEPYVYVGDKLLSIEMTSPTHQEEIINVYLDDEMVYHSRMLSGRPTYGEIDGPWSYAGHWVVILLDGKRDAQGNIEFVPRLIQDGEDINKKLNYEQVFQFALLDDRPFYFFQKDNKIGISYDDKEFIQGYDEIPHYKCCSSALLNPGISMNMIWFFARRGHDWYYVEAYVPLQ
jgi:hypothetical protein